MLSDLFQIVNNSGEGNLKRIFLFSFLLSLGTIISIYAQDLSGRFSLSPFVGISMPMGDLATQIMGEGPPYSKVEFKFGVSIDDFYTPTLAGGLNFRYVKFNVRNIEYEGETNPTSDKLSLMMFGVHSKFYLKDDGTVRPYGVLSGGLTILTLKDWNYVQNFREEIDLEINFLIAGGVSYFVSPSLSLFGEFTLDYLLRDFAGFEMVIEDEEIEDVTVYFNSYFINFMFGITIWFGGK
jgi:hypothetical protein